MQEFDDNQLVEQFIKGNEAALNELIARYFKQIFFFCKGYVKQDSEAEDVTQEVFVKLWKNIKKFDNQKKFKTWLYQIAKNTSIDFLRKNKLAIPAENLAEEDMRSAMENIPDMSIIPQDVLDSEIFTNKFNKILLELPELQSQTVVLYLQQDLTFQEIAEVLNEPLNTVKSRYRRGLLAIKEKLSSG
jgi:RNA polymerase sigma-70 factor (ECF subfamily)